MQNRDVNRAAKRAWSEIVATQTVSAGGSTGIISLTDYHGSWLGFYADGGAIHLSFGPAATVGAATTSYPPVASEAVEEFQIVPGVNDGVRAIAGATVKLVIFKAGGQG